MASQITQDQIIEMNELYLQIGTYAGVSRAMGGRPASSTVKKYIIPNYISREQIKVKKFDTEVLPTFSTFSPEIFTDVDNWGDLCVLSEEEEREIIELWKELLI